ERLENARYARPQAGNPERHGFKGWLPMEMTGAKKNLFKDKWLTHYVVSRVRGETNGDLFEEAAAKGGEFGVDPNDWSFVCRRGTGLADPPRTADNSARCGPR